MKKLGTLGLAADFRNHAGYVVLELKDINDESASGVFDLPPLRDENGAIYLPSTDAPAYRVAIIGSPDQLKRMGNALTASARAAAGKPDDDAEA